MDPYYSSCSQDTPTGQSQEPALNDIQRTSAINSASKTSNESERQCMPGPHAAEKPALGNLPSIFLSGSSEQSKDSDLDEHSASPQRPHSPSALADTIGESSQEQK